MRRGGLVEAFDAEGWQAARVEYEKSVRDAAEEHRGVLEALATTTDPLAEATIQRIDELERDERERFLSRVFSGFAVQAHLAATDFSLDTYVMLHYAERLRYATVRGYEHGPGSLSLSVDELPGLVTREAFLGFERFGQDAGLPEVGDA